MAQLPKEKRQKILLHQDAIYEKIQRRNISDMGPLCIIANSTGLTVRLLGIN